MKLIYANYAFLAAAIVLAVMSNANPQAVTWLEPWLSLMSLGLLIAVAWRLRGKDKRALGGRAHRHAQAQKRVLLLFLASGVLSSFQWILLFRQNDSGIDVNLVLQIVNWALFIAAAGQVAVGAVLAIRADWPKPPPPAATNKPETPAQAAP
jgi:hypothetical protein